MNCRLCKNPIKAGQPIWASYSGINAGYIYCQKCWEKEAKHDYWWADYGVKDLQCLCCGRTIHTRTSRDRSTCSPQCQLEFRRKRNRDNMQAKRKEEPKPASPVLKCSECGCVIIEDFREPRRDTRYCSGRCRQRAYRRRLKEWTKSEMAAISNRDR